MVELEDLVEREDVAEVRELIQRHLDYTGSTVAQDLLKRWDQILSQFVKVMPTDYKRVILMRKAQDEGKEVELVTHDDG